MLDAGCLILGVSKSVWNNTQDQLRRALARVKNNVEWALAKFYRIMYIVKLYTKRKALQSVVKTFKV